MISKEKRTKIIGSCLSIPAPLYLIYMVLAKGFLADVAVIAVTGAMCYVGVNLLLGKSVDQIKDKVKKELND